MVISQGEIWWADLPAPTGSGPGFRRPVIVVQCDAMNGSRLGTTVCVPLTSNIKWGAAPGNVSLSARLTGLPKDSKILVEPGRCEGNGARTTFQAQRRFQKAVTPALEFRLRRTTPSAL
jgi:mRNA-degrading endonuclease toxin of MazEF toxin-antitoxin module